MVDAVSDSLGSLATAEELRWLLRHSRPRPVRTMREFAEQEIVPHTGPYANLPFRCERQPYSKLWLDAVDGAYGLYNRFAALGPTQSGKSLLASVIPVLYHLFEIEETVIFAVCDDQMARDKWASDLEPAIANSRYRNLLPRHGAGSKGGEFKAITFGNGATLRFMTAAPGDKKTAAFTSRVLVVTEADAFDVVSKVSKETNKFKQLEARTKAYRSRKRVYLECTASVTRGRIWSEYSKGTKSRLVLPCPACKAWVTPERQDLKGWKTAATETAAEELARFHCPECDAPWSEDERRSANMAARLVHRGQSIDKRGRVTGDPPATRTLGFRWSAANNLLETAADIANDEWHAARADDEDDAEREMLQFVWALPYDVAHSEQRPIEVDEITRLAIPLSKGTVPPDTEYFSAALDIGKFLSHWQAWAWRADGSPHLVDYGRIEVPTADLGLEAALRVAMREFVDLCEEGWPVKDAPDRIWRPDAAAIDSSWQTETVYQFVEESGYGWLLPAKGHGVGQRYQGRYSRPKTTGNLVTQIGEEYHLVQLKDRGILLLAVNADHWKGFVHARIRTPAKQRGALTIFEGDPREHLTLAKHWTAEEEREEYLPGIGWIRRWVTLRKQNHHFDVAYLNCAAGHLAGARVVPEKAPQETKQPERPRLTMPDGRPYLVTER